MGVDLDLIRKKRQDAMDAAARRSASYYEWKPRNIIRLLPPWDGSDDFARAYGKHWRCPPDGKSTYYCPRFTSEGAPCPICEMLEAMAKRPGISDEERQKIWSEYGASQRYYANCLDLEDLDKGVQVIDLPKTVLEEIWGIMLDDDAGLGDITDPKKGFDLIIERTGKGLSTRYTVRAKRAPTPLPDPSVLTALPNLDKFVAVKDYGTLKALLSGRTEDEPELLPAPDAERRGSAIGEIIDTTMDTSATLTPTPARPACFGAFDETQDKCLNCIECDDCEAAASAAPAAEAASITPDDLMAEMEAAISR